MSKFIEDLVRPHVTGAELAAGYKAMAADDSREAAAREWMEALVQDARDEAR